jgi:polysaccharide biosynthesis PFTS motif protein
MTDLPNRRFSSEMVMYSLNSSGLVFKDDPVMANHPSIRHLRSDIIYIWNDSYRETLNQEKIFCKTVVVPPVVWYLPKAVSIKSCMSIRNICIFDISPLSSQALHNRGLRGQYYSTSTMKSFIEDIILASNWAEEVLSCNIQIILKHKRLPSNNHDFSYFQYVKNLCSNNKKFHLASEDENLYSLISDSDLVIVIPYSSPAYLAMDLKVPTVFYDPTGDLLFLGRNSEVLFCSGRTELEEIMIKNIAYHKES